MAQVAKDLGLEFWPLIGNQIDSLDVRGAPVPQADGTLKFHIMGALSAASKRPCLLFLDEWLATSPGVRAALLSLITERRIGDVVLHPGTRIIAATNDPDMTPGGFVPEAPILARFAWFRLEPTADEVAEYLRTLGKPGDALRKVGLEYAAILEADHKMMCLQPPADAIAGQIVGWANPRQIEKAIRIGACDLAATKALTFSSGARTMITGLIGAETLAGWEAYRLIYGQLPTAKQILADPMGAAVPTDTAQAVAALVILSTVGTVDAWAAWSYAGRIYSPEVKAAAFRSLLKADTEAPGSKASKFRQQGEMARIAYLSSVNRGQ